MKNTILATMLVLATSAASAQVAAGGKIGQWVDNTKTGTASATSLVTEPTSNFTVTAGEKLANGLTARAVIDTSFSGNTIAGSGTQLGDRQGTVGIASKLGSVDLGRNVHSQFLAITNNDVFGTMYGSVAGDVHNLRGLRMSNGTFVSVTPIKGLTVTADNAHNASGGNASTYSASGSAMGVNGTVATYTLGAEKSTVLGLSAKVGNTTLTYTHSDDKGVRNSKGDLGGVAQTYGPYTAKASFGKTNTDVKVYALGLDYNLSKRTAVGFAYNNVDATGTAQDVSKIGVGVTHRF
jgi:hypothetical protein